MMVTAIKDESRRKESMMEDGHASGEEGLHGTKNESGAVTTQGSLRGFAKQRLEGPAIL